MVQKKKYKTTWLQRQKSKNWYRQNKKRHRKMVDKWNKNNPKKRRVIALKAYYRKHAINKKKARKYAKKHAEQRKRYMRTKNILRYGLTYKRYKQLMNAQKGKCKICLQFRVKGTDRRLNIDHCHKTGKIRGLLCYACNTALGMFRDNPKILMRAVRYLL